MNLQFIPASARAVVRSALPMALPFLSGAQTAADPGRPVVLDVSSVSLEKNVQLSSLIAEIRSQADAFRVLGFLERGLACLERCLHTLLRFVPYLGANNRAEIAAQPIGPAVADAREPGHPFEVALLGAKGSALDVSLRVVGRLPSRFAALLTLLS
jgi:hypothetical protein